MMRQFSSTIWDSDGEASENRLRGIYGFMMVDVSRYCEEIGSSKEAACMSTIRLINMHASAWSERVRWALAFKGVTYENEEYQPGPDDEKKIEKLSGQKQVPVLVADGTAIPDSTAILHWLEHYKPKPALLPELEKDRAQVTLWEELMDWVVGPQGRMLIIGRLIGSGEPTLQQVGQFFSQKYQHSSYAEQHARSTLERVLTSLASSLAGREYLVGDAFTRADLTTACMLMVVNPAPDQLFPFPAIMRPIYTDALASSFAPVFAWRDEMYRKHRGEVVRT
jgi:glutathione S-transferase